MNMAGLRKAENSLIFLGALGSVSDLDFRFSCFPRCVPWAPCWVWSIPLAKSPSLCTGNLSAVTRHVKAMEILRHRSRIIVRNTDYYGPTLAGRVFVCFVFGD